MDETAMALLGPLERRVMSRLWAVGPSTVAEVVAHLNDSVGPTLAYTTVLTELTRLFEKGYVTRTKDGRAFRYAPAADQASIVSVAARRELRELGARFGRAMVAEFAADLAGADPDVLRRLHELAESEDDQR